MYRPAALLLSILIAALCLGAPSAAPAADDGSLSLGTGVSGGQRVFTDVMRALGIDKKHGLKILIRSTA